MTGVQTCALPICFPVTINGELRVNEIWEKIKGFDNYIVSNKGNVINTKFGILKKQRNTKTGYKIIDLKENGKKKTQYIHRLVAEAFIPNINNLPQVNHKDENKGNNNVDLKDRLKAAELLGKRYRLFTDLIVTGKQIGRAHV